MKRNIRLASRECPADPGDLGLLLEPQTQGATSGEQELFSSTGAKTDDEEEEQEKGRHSEQQ